MDDPSDDFFGPRDPAVYEAALREQFAVADLCEQLGIEYDDDDDDRLTADDVRVLAERRAELPTANGPQPPNLFTWRGKQIELPPLPWRLVNYLWDCLEHRCRIHSACDAVWEHDASANAIKGAISKANNAFAEANMPLCIRQKQGFLVFEVQGE